jgi:hypothetical protein
MRGVFVGVGVLTVLIAFFLIEYQLTTGSETTHLAAVRELSSQLAHMQSQYMKNLEEISKKYEHALRQQESERAEKERLQQELEGASSCKDVVASLREELAKTGGAVAAPAPAPAQTGACKPSLKLIGPAAGWADRAKSYPTYDILRSDLFGDAKVFEDWPNFHKKSSDHTYPHTFIKSVHLDELWAIKQPKFVVEVGSFTGGSTVVIGSKIREKGLKGVPFLCIDTWLGDLNMWLNKAVWNFLDVRWGRPTVWDQWFLNVITANLTDTVIPFSTTSLLGARWLKAHNYQVDFLYLDSAHEIDETFFELELYYDLLSPGGILAGDDYNWEAVYHDVNKFAKEHNLIINFVTTERQAGGPWYLIKQ